MGERSAKPVDYLEGLMEGFVAYDAAWVMTYINASGERLLGRRREDVLGKTWHQAFPHAVGNEVDAMYQRVMRTRKPAGMEYYYPHYGMWMEISASPASDGGVGVYFRDVSDRKSAEAALQEANARLREAAQRKDEFLAMLAHELRNPLSPMQTALEVLNLKQGDPAAMNWARNVFGRQVGHLARLVDDLLDVSRITSGKIALRFETLDLGHAVRDTLEAMRPQIEQRRHRLTLTLSPTPLYVRADPTRLAQVVTNLVANSAKYTPDGGAIDVTVERDGDFAMLSVVDNGIGIAPELVPRIFDLFVQGDRALDRKEGGLGIGLTLVKRLVELHGGTIAAASGGVRAGSQFTVRLPMRAADRPVTEAAAGAVPSAQRMFRVMVVDDNADAAQSLGVLLEIMGHNVEIQGDALSALARAPIFQPDLILLDVGLPHMSGYDVARAMRAQPMLREVMLVACTGYGQDEDRRRSREAGFDYHLVKPVHTEDLERIFSEMTGRAARDAGGARTD